MRRLLTVGEYADQTRVSRATIYRLVKAGELEAVRIGTQIRIPARALERMIGQCIEAPQTAA